MLYNDIHSRVPYARTTSQSQLDPRGAPHVNPLEATPPGLHYAGRDILTVYRPDKPVQKLKTDRISSNAEPDHHSPTGSLESASFKFTIKFLFTASL